MFVCLSEDCALSLIKIQISNLQDIRIILFENFEIRIHFNHNHKSY